MSLAKLARLDLNLLVCLHVLLECNSVSRAAEQLHLTQSAISKSLARLRELFDDPLLERSGYGMAPTPRAKALQPALKQLLEGVEKLTAPTVFEPQHSERVFNIAAVESVYALLFQSFIGEVFSSAPKVTVDTDNWGLDTFELLQRGELDFAITGADLHPGGGEPNLIPPKGIASAELCRNQLCCLVHQHHPALSQPWDLDCYISYRHIGIKTYRNERWQLDDKLADMGLARDVALFASDLHSAAEFCCHTDAIVTAPSLFANRFAPRWGLQVLPLPFEVSPLCYTLFWNQNRNNDPAHAWLKNLIISRCQGALANG